MANCVGLLKTHHESGGTVEWQAGLPVLRSPVLTLRELCYSDAPSLSRWLKRGDGWQFTATLPANAAGFEPFIAATLRERRAGRGMCFAILPLGLRDVVGFVVVRRLDQGGHAGRCAIALGEPFYATPLLAAAVEVVIDFAFRHVGYHRVEARSVDAREDEVFKALGAVREGVLRGVWNASGEPVDGTLWSFLSDEWTALPREASYDPQRPSAAPPRAPDSRPAPEDDPACNRPKWAARLPVLVSGGLTLREVEAADAPHLLRALNPHDIREFLDPPPLTEKLLRQYIAWAIRERELGRAGCYAIVVEGGRPPVGLAQFRQIDPKFVAAEWGSVVAAAHRGNGLHPRVTELLLSFLFDEVGISRLEAQMTRQNLAALGSLRAAGGAREATLRRVAVVGDQLVDQELWVVLRRDWRRPGFQPV